MTIQQDFKQFGVTIFLPDPFDDKVFYDQIDIAMNTVADRIRRHFERTVKTWVDKPKFITLRSNANDEISVQVRTAIISSRKPPELIYYFLNYGTRKRRAKMSGNFVPKTRVRVLDSFPGQGGVVAVIPNRNFGRIKARRWDSEIQKEVRKPFHKFIRDALRVAAVRSKHDYP